MAYEKEMDALNSAIERVMADKGISITDMASRLGMSVQSLYNKRSGKHEWRWSEVMALSELADESLDALVGWKEAS